MQQPAGKTSEPQSSVSRRVFLAAGFGGAALFSARKAPAFVTSPTLKATPACVLSGEQTEGPYYVDRKILRSDITEGRPGVPLRLRITVLDATRCAPLPGAAVDLWHCDSGGIYSGYVNASLGPGFGPGGRPPGPPPDGRWSMPPPPRFEGEGRPGGPDFRPGFGPPPKPQPSDKEAFFRGVQMTDKNGVAEFKSIYPGWYVGRSVHIHMKVWTKGSWVGNNFEGGHACHTGQLFFPEDLTDTVAKLKPYNEHRVQRTAQQEDDVFTSQAGPDCIVSLDRIDKHSLADGFVATAVLGVNPLLTPRPAFP